MKLREIFRFEVLYQMRRAWLWLIVAVLVVLSFMLARDGMLAEALFEDFFINSPFAIAKTTVIGGLIWLVAAAAVAGEAAARDTATGMHPLTFTAPVSKLEYLGGRFLAALFVNALLLLAVQAGILLAVYAPGVDPVSIGPFRPSAHLTSYAILALPNAVAGTAIQFSLSTRSGRPMAGYIGSFLLVFLTFFVATILVVMRGPGTLLDFIGVHYILSDLSHQWTTYEKSWRLLALEGTVLANRLLWLGVAVGALATTYASFRFAHRTERARWKPWRRRWGAPAVMPARTEPTASRPISVPEVAQSFRLTAEGRKTWAIAWESFRTTAGSWPGRAMLIGIPLLTILVVLDQMVALGTPLTPKTILVVRELTGPLSAELSRWVIVPLLSIFFAGELVWREREAGLGEITDAMPGSEWTRLLGKVLGFSLLLLLFVALLAAAGMVAQAIMGHHAFEIGLYLKLLIGMQLTEYLLFVPLAFVVHVAVDQKYIGHLVAMLAYMIIALASMFGLEHNMLIYGASPGWSFTEIRGFGASLMPWLWFKLYWAGWALSLAVGARLLWVRGRERGLTTRLQLARGRMTRPTAWTAAVAVAIILATGGFIFYNTNVLNEYLRQDGVTARKAEYERRYGRYEGIPQPQLTSIKLRAEIHPDKRVVEMRGSYRLENLTSAAIDSIHISVAPGVETGDLVFDRAAKFVGGEDHLPHRIFALAKPLPPGGSIAVEFTVQYEPRGFSEGGSNASVVANGTSLPSAWLPAIGYQASLELMNAADRRAHGLPPRPLIPSLYDVEERKKRSAGIDFEAVVGTDEDQLAVAPGALRRSWMEDGRRYFHYATDGPIGGEWKILSAEYAVHEMRWEDPESAGRVVNVRIVHDPAHAEVLEWMAPAIRASLDFYTTNFGAYPYRHLTFAEHPGIGTGMHADAGLITFTEGSAFWNPNDDPVSLQLPFAVVAHEMAHQWTVPSASVEGAPVMSESLAWYYAMQVVEATHGRDQLRRLLSFMRQPYPYAPIRRGEPLLRALDPYMSYRKGPFALHALSEYMGAERVNRALRRLLEKHRPSDAPLATTLDLYGELEAVTPDSLRYLLHDLFEVNTFWEFETEGVTAEQASDGTWQVTLQIAAEKVVADTAGVEIELPMDEWVEIGVFGRPLEGVAELSAPLYLERHRIRSGRQTITVTVAGEPFLAGIDPHHVLDWEEGEDDDNIEPVNIANQSI